MRVGRCLLVACADRVIYAWKTEAGTALYVTVRYRLHLHTRKCVACSGESGAGKTETMKQLLQYAQEATSAPLARAGSAGDTATTHGEARTEGIGMRLMHINPMLEAFGNAATVCNDNSSRFGKYIGLSMDASGAMVSAELRTYLLETSRLTIRDDTELNFHIFYQLVQARSPPLCARRPSSVPCSTPSVVLRRTAQRPRIWTAPVRARTATSTPSRCTPKASRHGLR